MKQAGHTSSGPGSRAARRTWPASDGALIAAFISSAAAGRAQCRPITRIRQRLHAAVTSGDRASGVVCPHLRNVASHLAGAKL